MGSELLISYIGYSDQTVKVNDKDKYLIAMPKADLIPLVYADFDKAIEGLPATYGVSEAIHGLTRHSIWLRTLLPKEVIACIPINCLFR